MRKNHRVRIFRSLGTDDKAESAPRTAARLTDELKRCFDARAAS
jgi:hypothetical protein